MLSLKFGVGRLRHIRGRMFWLQQTMSNHELSIKQVPTTYNIADLSTKGLGRDRFLSLLFMIGFVKGEPVREAEFLRLQAKERIKAHVKVIGSCLKDTTSMTSHGVSSTNMNKTAKRVLRILSTCSLLELADGYEVDGMSPSPEALGLWSYVFRAMILAICFAVGFVFLAGVISFGRRNPVRDAEVQEPQEVPFQDEADGGDLGEDQTGETASDRWHRYKNCSMSECSDPEYWMQLNHFSSCSSESEEQPHDLVASMVIEAFDRSVNIVTEKTLCEYLLLRCTRRLSQAADEDTRAIYNDRVISLRTSCTDMCEGRRTIPRLQLRDIFREFARLSPCPNSPTFAAAMSLDDVISELLQMESNAVPRDGATAVEIDGAGGTTSSAADNAVPMEVDDNGNANMEVDVEPVIYGPRTHDESLLEDIHTQRDRMLREIREHLDGAYNTGSQEQIWYWQDQENWWLNAVWGILELYCIFVEQLCYVVIFTRGGMYPWYIFICISQLVSRCGEG